MYPTLLQTIYRCLLAIFAAALCRLCFTRTDACRCYHLANNEVTIWTTHRAEAAGWFCLTECIRVYVMHR